MTQNAPLIQSRLFLPQYEYEKFMQVFKYRVIIVAIGHRLLKKYWHMVIGCLLCTAVNILQMANLRSTEQARDREKLKEVRMTFVIPQSDKITLKAGMMIRFWPKNRIRSSVHQTKQILNSKLNEYFKAFFFSYFWGQTYHRSPRFRIPARIR